MLTKERIRQAEKSIKSYLEDGLLKKAIMDKQCDAISYAFPEKYIQDAHTHYECLALSLYYLGEAFKLLVQNPGKMPTHQEIDAIMKRDYKHVKAREQL